MKKKLFNKKSITPACGVCEYGKLSLDGESVLCYKTGIRQIDSSCHGFKYDPLKRKPQKEPQMISFVKSDFEL